MRDNEAPRAVRRADYRVPEFLIDTVALYVDIREQYTEVTADLSLRRNPASDSRDGPLRLDGDGIALQQVMLDGVELLPAEYVLDERALTIGGVPAAFRLRTVGRIDPAANTALEGLYMSHGMYCTQCEAEGFRRITWYLDRPDVMARFRTTIEAGQADYPLLLSNGNCVAREALPNGRHRATWDDPFPKPCYLFALVAADLACHEDEFTTRSGRRVDLRLYVEPRDLDKTAHAMDSLKRAMRWDEEVYGLEYDLDVYMIVAVSHFNMGAMENKGLNVFNTSCVLANPLTQTDKAFQRVEAVVAHEYFHNWSGNRVTCRDWFQLSLKEGFTVFRDAEFSKDMHSRVVKRIEEVNFLRSVQFPEDAGPLAHPVRPDEYVEINNFYTVTIYEKGAEVVRMLHTLLGTDGFRRGSDLYFSRHDGQAATCEDFVCAMEDANGIDLSRFRRWYSQAGTPVLTVSSRWDAGEGEYRLRFSQSCPPTPGQDAKLPLVIPVMLGLLDGVTGKPVVPELVDARLQARDGDWLFAFAEPEAELVFGGLSAEPLPSLLRGFSAPVDLRIDYEDGQLAFLARYDGDAFNRWNSAQALYERTLLQAVAAVQQGREPVLPSTMLDLVRAVLAGAGDDPALAAEMLVLPAEGYLADRLPVADPDAIHRARSGLRRQLVSALRPDLLAALAAFRDGSWSASAPAIARRALRNTVLELLGEAGDAGVAALVHAQFLSADNMTDQLAALRTAVHAGLEGAGDLLARFHAQWSDEALVIDQWFSIQASSPAADALERVEQLRAHARFELTNPNRVRALVGAFAGGNPVQFHRADGAGYRFLAGMLLELDAVNPQIAARIAGHFSRWRRFDVGRQSHAAAAMEQVLARQGLSPNLYEVVHKTRFDGNT